AFGARRGGGLRGQGRLLMLAAACRGGIPLPATALFALWRGAFRLERLPRGLLWGGPECLAFRFCDFGHSIPLLPTPLATQSSVALTVASDSRRADAAIVDGPHS